MLQELAFPSVWNFKHPALRCSSHRLILKIISMKYWNIRISANTCMNRPQCHYCSLALLHWFLHLPPHRDTYLWIFFPACLRPLYSLCSTPSTSGDKLEMMFNMGFAQWSYSLTYYIGKNVSFPPNCALVRWSVQMGHLFLIHVKWHGISIPEENRDTAHSASRHCLAELMQLLKLNESKPEYSRGVLNFCYDINKLM